MLNAEHFDFDIFLARQGRKQVGVFIYDTTEARWLTLLTTHCERTWFFQIANTKSVQTSGHNGLLHDKDDYIAKHDAGVWPSTELSSSESVWAM